MANIRVAFDEAGNTGQNLLDPDQEIFVLSSVCLSDSDASSILGLAGRQGELHFRNLKRSAAGRRAIVDVLRSPLLTRETLKIAILHKPFMVVGKIVDLLIEELLRRLEIDLYERGGNIALSNLIYCVTPTLCGRDRFEQLQAKFVRMVRTKAGADVRAFYDVVDSLCRHCINERYMETLELLRQTRAIVDDVLSQVEITTLDPAVPAFLALCQAWEDQLDCTFDIIHDPSKAIAFDQDLLERYMDPDAVTQRILGVDRRKVKLPFRATGIVFVGAANDPQIQIADLVASSYAYFHKNRNTKKNSGFVSSLSEIIFGPGGEGWLVGGLWPTPDVTPKELGIDGPTGESVVDGMARFLRDSYAEKPEPPKTS